MTSFYINSIKLYIRETSENEHKLKPLYNIIKINTKIEHKQTYW